MAVEDCAAPVVQWRRRGGPATLDYAVLDCLVVHKQSDDDSTVVV